MPIDPSKVQWDTPKIDAAKVQWDAAPAPAPSAQPQRSFADEAVRQVGLTARAGAQGLLAIPGMVSDAATGLVNTGLDAAMGKGNGFRFQKVSSAADNLMNSAGLPQAETKAERVVQDATQAMAGAGGLVGVGTRMAAQTAAPLSQGVGKVLADNALAQTVGGATGGLASGATREAGGGVGAQLAAGLAGGLAGGALASVRRPGEVVNSQKQQAAQQALDNGYVVPPVDTGGGLMAEVLNGVGGKIKTAQVASARNQSVTDNLARKALGLQDGAEMSRDSLAAMRTQLANQAYGPVASAGQVGANKRYLDSISKAMEPFQSMASSFPGAKPPPVVDDLSNLWVNGFDAKDGLTMIKALRESADKAYRAGDGMAGKAYKQGASAVENAIEDHLSSMGASGAELLKNFRGARQQIAKTYTVEKALNPQTGSVNAQQLARDLGKGKPLVDELRTIGETAQAFPRATQALKEAPNQFGILDVVSTGGLSAMTGSALPAVVMGARPVARTLALSKMAQREAVRNAGTKARGIGDAKLPLYLNAMAQVD